ncbi:MAG: DUF512 domain-containing protein [Clostridia bacterium]|nr:DUF512 domain-containing protein [Clostridia bacterium]
MVKIKSVDKNSRAARAGIAAGDILISVNGHEINDVLDYGFYLAERNVEIKLTRGGEVFIIKIKKGVYDDVGLNFETPLMDKKHRCENGCIFCFIDQNPKGMRESVYFKDDDSRLSFIHGNYITLTNLDERDIDRIIEMHISPINISVHTTDPELRVKMMKNKKAGEVLSYMNRLAAGGIELHCQIVLCRGINDGDVLKKTMTDLSYMYPSVTSVSIVPAGLTGHRDGLYPLTPFSQKEAAEIVRLIEDFGSMCAEKYGSRIFYASDELYIKAEIPIPDADFYGDFEQLEDGVGMIADFLSEIDAELRFIDTYDYSPDIPRNVSMATGEAAAPFIKKAVEKIESVCYNLHCEVYTVKNEFFGGEVTVAGLLTGVDIARTLRGQNLGDELLVPASALRSEDGVFLCGHTTEWLSNELGVPVKSSKSSAADFISGLLGCEAESGDKFER